MSFSSEVKNEICRIEGITKEEAKAELSAIMKVSGTLLFSGNMKFSFKVSTENASIAKHIFVLLKKFFNIHSDLVVKKSNSLKKNNAYEVLITQEMGSVELLKSLGILQEGNFFSIDNQLPINLLVSNNCRKAYIRGAFLGGGSISNPQRTYHVEFVTHDYEYAVELSGLINKFSLASKVVTRKSSYIVYIKEGEQIADLLSLIGAFSSVLQFENIRIMKDMRNNVNRIVNCETANLSKTVNASVRQVECIKYIEKKVGLRRLPKNLRDIAEVRLSYPDKSLKELGELLNPPVGKSGVNHRFRKIEKIADELKNEEELDL